MKLDFRKEKILSAVVESYAATGEPVGSKALQEALNPKVSSATIRNEMSELTAFGFLDQPHTSAGRVPSDSGYRYYVDNLMKKETLSQQAKDAIDRRLGELPDSPEQVLKTAVKVISDITGSAAACTTPDGRKARVHKIRFAPISRRTAMAILVTSTGMVKTGLFRCEFVITPEMLAVFDKALGEKLMGCPLSELTLPFIQTLAASFGELALFIPSVLSTIVELANQAMVSVAIIEGKINVLYMPELGIENSRRLLGFFNHGPVARFLLESCRESEVLIGTETKIPELSEIAVIMSRYEISGHKTGVLAAFCNKRTDYSARIAVMEYIAKSSSRLLNELVSEESLQ